jgi:hypothetical protein
MKLRTITLALAAAAVMLVGLAGTGLAFHDGGVATCSSCHTMHNSKGNQIADSQLLTQFTAGPMLLLGNTQSDACLNCHGAGGGTSGYHVATEGATTEFAVPQQFSPGGDFSWLTVGTGTNKDQKGHNIKATDYGFNVDGKLTAAPGGTYLAANLGCQACHDPHGRYRYTVASPNTAVLPVIGTTFDPIATYGSYGALPGNGEATGVYRILGGVGYVPKSYTGGPSFSAGPPIAVAPSTYNTTDGYKVRVAYGQGMSEWCANCHTQIHNDAYPATRRHPSGNGAKLTAAVADNYNAYKKTGDLTGTIATSYEPLVPFETGSNDRAALAALAATIPAGTQLAGPDTNSNVMCLSCHRSHASAFPAMLRYNLGFIAEAGAYMGISGVSSIPQSNAAYYNKPVTDFATDQRGLCNKCHAKD